MPCGVLNWPAPEPEIPGWHDAVQTSAWGMLSATPQPAASTNAPAALNLSIRLLFWSATHRVPPVSMARPAGVLSWPAPPPETPLRHVVVQVSKLLMPSTTPQPWALLHLPVDDDAS